MYYGEENEVEMDLARTEKIVLVILSVLLVAGGQRLYAKHSRPFRKIEIIRGGVKEEFTLKEVTRQLREKRKVKINTASAGQIASVPGIGEVLAGRIVECRDIYGRFNDCGDLSRVQGIGEKKSAVMAEYLRFE